MDNREVTIYALLDSEVAFDNAKGFMPGKKMVQYGWTKRQPVEKNHHTVYQEKLAAGPKKIIPCR